MQKFHCVPDKKGTSYGLDNFFNHMKLTATTYKNFFFFIILINLLLLNKWLFQNFE
jgi:hypothetical protein